MSNTKKPELNGIATKAGVGSTEFTNYNILCTCGARIPFFRSTTDLNCPDCQARISIRYIGLHEPVRAIIEKVGSEFLKGIYSFKFNIPHEWSSKLQSKKFEEFQKFAKLIYSNRLSMKAKTLDANKQILFTFFYANEYRVDLGPYDITTQIGFTEYLFNCVKIQVPDFVFSPGSYDCPARFEVVVNDSTPYYVLHYVTPLHPLNKGGKITMISPSVMNLEFFFRIELTDTKGEESEWHLIDGQLAPIKSSKEALTVYTLGFRKKTKDMRLAKIRQTLGENVASKVHALFEAKKDYSFAKMELETELGILGLIDYKDRLFEILQFKGSCFVVTACMGDENHYYVVSLRRFRDEVLSKCQAGRYLIEWYSIVGPYLARLIRSSLILRKVLTFLVVRPSALFASHYLSRHLHFEKQIL